MTVISSSSQFDRRALLGAGIGGAGLLATGCSIFDSGSGGGGGGGGDGEDGPAITIARTSDIDSLDPHYVNSSMYILPASMMEGLVMQDESGSDVVPALAESWDVSEDELTYTFHLRQANWSNGDPVTAEDAVWSFQRLLSPTGAGSGYTTGASSYLPSVGIRGAAEYQSGALEAWEDVGVTAPDDSTVVIELESPNPDLLLNMTHYSMSVLHPPTVEAEPQDWTLPENWVGNGPYVLTDWVPNSTLEMEKNPEYWDADNVQVQRITVQLAGELTTQTLAFRNDELDIIGVTGETLQTDPDLEESAVRVDGYSTFYLQSMWGGHEAIQDQRVRRAISMAIDREAMTATNAGIMAAGSLIPDTVPGWSDELLVPFDPDGARALLEETGVADDLPGLRIQAGYEEPILEIMREGLIDVLGLDVAIDVLEEGVQAETRWQPHDDADVMSFYYGSFAGVSTMPNWIFNIFGSDHVRQFSMPYEAWEELQAVQADESLEGPEVAAQVEEILSSRSTDEAQQYAELAEDAMSTLDEDERARKFIDAAALREELAYTIPLAWGAQLLAGSDRLDGIQLRPSPEGYYYKHLTVSE
ncbi:MAG TPA: peptide ABC transporter substrate-binding protein [Actinomycetaceae bacterium]|nr:peptide ABC transporter substrate-binding protein [Actinomycetaceae bacterium]